MRLSISGPVVFSEGSAGATTRTYVIARSGSLASALPFAWSVSGMGGNPVDGNDFVGGVLPSGTGLISSGSSSATISFAIAGDSQLESDEQFRIDVAANLQIGASLIGTILNDDTQAAYAPSLFTFTDTFDTGETVIRKRPGWSRMSRNYLGLNNIAVTSGYLHVGGSDGTAVQVDIGRTDTLFVQGRLANLSDGQEALWFRLLDEANGYYIKVVGAGLYVCRMTNGAEQILPGAGYADAHTDGDLWRVEVTGNTAIILKNGTRFPNAATSWDLSAHPASGRVGFCGTLGLGGAWDDFQGGYGTSALPRLALDPVRRVVQRAKGTSAAQLTVTGQHSGVNALECRLLNAATNAVIAGWDWGQKPLTDVVLTATTFTATTAAIPQGDGYRIELRSVDDVNARSISRAFGVGIVVAIYGQSNAAFFTGAGQAGSIAAGASSIWYNSGLDQPAASDGVHNAGAVVSNRGLTWMLNRLSDAAGVPVLAVGTGYVSQPIDNLRPGSSFINAGFAKTFWATFEAEVGFAGGDIEALLYVQGESDAGLFPGNSYTSAASYKAALSEMRDRLLAVTGRSAGQFVFGIAGLGRLADVDNSDARGTGWDTIRQAQAEWCRDTAGAALLCTTVDLPPRTGESPQPHYAWNETGLGELGKRAAAGIARLLGCAATDRRGPLAGAPVRSGNTIAITFDLNGSGALSCAAAIASNFVFAADASFATALVPTAMAISGATVTWTFASAPPAGTAVRGPRGVNPAVANALMGNYADGSAVITLPIYTPIVAA